MYHEKRFSRIQMKNGDTLDERLSNLLISAAIYPNFKGFFYIKSAAMMAITDPTVLKEPCTTLYPVLAEFYKTTVKAVEIAIKRTINAAWEKGKKQTFDTLIGKEIFKGDKRPTGRRIITLIADTLRPEIAPDPTAEMSEEELAEYINSDDSMFEKTLFDELLNKDGGIADDNEYDSTKGESLEWCFQSIFNPAPNWLTDCISKIFNENS